MAKEQTRKRGKRKPKTEDEFQPATTTTTVPTGADRDEQPDGGEAESGGIHPSRMAMLKGGPRLAPAPAPKNEEDNGPQEEGNADWTRGPREDSEFPFGVLDPDVKAYFRNVEDQIKDWEGVGSMGEEREDRQLFLTSVLDELRGHELQVATDPETSVVLERLLPSLDDWKRRVIGDSVGDNWETLLRHRFGSHVAQTWLTLAASTLDREARDVYPRQPRAAGGDEGTLPTMTDIVTLLVNSILDRLPALLTSQFASPVLRLLLLVLTPNRALPSLDAAEGAPGGDLVRSKRSGKFRKGQGVQGKSILGDDDKKRKATGTEQEIREVPSSVASLRHTIRVSVMERIEPNEWKAMGMDKVGSATVQLLLEMEVEEKDAEKAGSLLDAVTDGLVGQLESNPKAKLERQGFLSTLQVSPTGTRLFEAILTYAPKGVFKAIWRTYFVGDLSKLASHPFANFVVAKGISRLSSKQLEEAISEIQGVSGGKALIKTSRTSVLLAMAERTAALDSQASGVAVASLLKTALALPANGKSDSALVPSLMTLKLFPVYDALKHGRDVPDDVSDIDDAQRDDTAEAQAQAKARRSAWENRRSARPKDTLAPSMQGCLLLQSLVATPGANVPVLDSLFAQDVNTLLEYAASPVASHLLDKVLTTPSPTLPVKYRKMLYTAFMGHYHELCSTKLGSRVADTVWDTADGFMRQRIANSLLPHATQLAADQYGRFLARRLELHLLERRPDEWRERVLGVRHHFAHQKDAPAPVAAVPVPLLTSAPADREDDSAHQSDDKDRKRKDKKDKKDKKRKKEKDHDEIDELFGAAEKKKRRE